MAVNKVILVGNVGKDPEVHFIEANVAVARFPFATSETYRSKDGEKITTTEWHNIVLWRGLAEVVDKYVKKGSQLYIEGKIRTRSYDDKEGNKRYITEIIADNMQMLGKKGDTGSSDGSMSQGSQGTQGSQAEPAKNDISNNGGNVSEDPLNGGSGETDDLPF
ncbi:MAG: single-stranded DNA-binding protein [Bacteroidales bacterium]|nr:single-stranded DNA-binding protein [Bacteroidales bacterium]